jgi:preprotein translocase subunit YajC
MNLLLAILAQDAAPKPRGGAGMQLWIGIILMIAVFYFVLFRGNPRSRKQREQMLGNLKKNDRILTRGGIVGTVVNVKDKEVVVKVDETTNTKMTFLKDAIWQVVQDEGDLKMEESR